MTAPGFFLRSGRLGFRPWSADDFELAWGLWGDPEVTRLMGGPFSEEYVRERLAREIETLRSVGVQYWPCFLLATGEHVGCCGLRPYKNAFAFGFHLRPEHWGHGLAGEAARSVLAHAFSTLAASTLFAGHHPRNDPSRRLLGKLGFKFSFEEVYPPTGLPQPWYSLTAEDFEAARGSSSS
jgi:RimJ/RimL family protein N-acetyltransferase